MLHEPAGRVHFFVTHIPGGASVFHLKRSLQGAQNLTVIQPLSEPGVNAESAIISRPKGKVV